MYYVHVTEASVENVEIITLKAFDPDIDPTQTITYNIVSGNLVGYFEIDSKTGTNISFSYKHFFLIVHVLRSD